MLSETDLRDTSPKLEPEISTREKKEWKQVVILMLLSKFQNIRMKGRSQMAESNASMQHRTV
jgi:hypothetical protein